MVEARAQRAPQLQEVASVRRGGETFPYSLDRGDPAVRELERQARETLGDEWLKQNAVSIGGTTFVTENFTNLARAVGGDNVSFQHESVNYHANGQKPQSGPFILIGRVKFYPEREPHGGPNGKMEDEGGRHGAALQEIAQEIKPGNTDSRFNDHGLTDLEGLISQSMGFIGEYNLSRVTELVEIAQDGNFEERQEAVGLLAKYLFGMLLKMAYRFPERSMVSRLDLIQAGYEQVLISLPRLDITRHPVRYIKKAAKSGMRRLVYPHSMGYKATFEELEDEPAIDSIGKKGRNVSLDSMEEELRDEVEFEVVAPNPTEKTAIDAVEQDWVRQGLAEALKGLKSYHREVISGLYGLEDGVVKSMPELAKSRGATKQAINQADKGALKKLRANPGVQDLAEALD